MKQSIIIRTEAHRRRALDLIASLPLEPAYEIVIKEHKTIRNSEQNAKLWAMLTDISSQVNWHGQYLTKDEWKDVITAGLKRQKVVAGIDGGFVVIGAHTSKMSVAEMSDLIELATAFGYQNGVKWTDYDY